MVYAVYSNIAGWYDCFVILKIILATAAYGGHKNGVSKRNRKQKKHQRI